MLRRSLCIALALPLALAGCVRELTLQQRAEIQEAHRRWEADFRKRQAAWTAFEASLTPEQRAARAASEAAGAAAIRQAAQAQAVCAAHAQQVRYTHPSVGRTILELDAA